MASSITSVQPLIESRMRDALAGDPYACFDIGVALASGRRTRQNVIEAQKWFNLAETFGSELAGKSATDRTCGISWLELAEAQRRTNAARPSKVRQEAAQFSAWAFG